MVLLDLRKWHGGNCDEKSFNSIDLEVIFLTCLLRMNPCYCLQDAVDTSKFDYYFLRINRFCIK